MKLKIKQISKRTMLHKKNQAANNLAVYQQVGYLPN